MVLFAQEDACRASTDVIPSSFNNRFHAAHTRRHTTSSPSRKSVGCKTTTLCRDSIAWRPTGQRPHQSSPPVMDSDAADTEVWCLESIDDDEIDRLKAFVLAVWTFTATSVSAYRGKRGLDPKRAVNEKQADDDDPSLPARSQGCTGAAEEEVVSRRLAAMEANFKVEGDRRYRTKHGAEPMDVTCAPMTAC